MRIIYGLFKLLLILGFLFAIFYGLLTFILKPSNERTWSEDQEILPTISIDNNFINIKNIRDFIYTSTSTYTKKYYDQNFDLNKIKGAYFMVEPFSGNSGAAHTLISFEFENNQFVVISVEIRKEKGEKFSALKGLFRQYELMYVIASENDALKLRTNYRKDKVYLYPITADKEKIKELFIDMLNRAKDLQEKPEFYNTISNTCTTNIVDHAEKISGKNIFKNFKILLPANSDTYAQDLGFIGEGIDIESLRNKYYITDKAQACKPNENFSICVRK